jgi:SAM-dependent methyltransferase
VACGTGKSFMPLVRRGYEVTACDISPGMVELARAKLPPDAADRVVVADMRALPWRGAFDLVTCLDDAVNYLLTDGDLQAALRGMSAALRPGGVAVFDVNSLRTYRETFAEDLAFRSEDAVFVWRGRGRPDRPAREPVLRGHHGPVRWRPRPVHEPARPAPPPAVHGRGRVRQGQPRPPWRLRRRPVRPARGRARRGSPPKARLRRAKAGVISRPGR